MAALNLLAFQTLRQLLSIYKTFFLVCRELDIDFSDKANSCFCTNAGMKHPENFNSAFGDTINNQIRFICY